MQLKENAYGTIFIDDDVLLSLVSASTRSCYGVIAVSRKHPVLDLAHDLFSKEPISGVYFERDETGVYHVEVYIVIKLGLPVFNICEEVKKRIKYDIENYLGIKVATVNVFVDDIRNY